MSGHAVDILLATYNGSRFVEQQIASLAAQSFKDWHLLIRDDGSSDDTLAVVRACAERHAISYEIESGSPLGACGSFASLLSRSTAPYFAFCDQDDVWLPDKLEKMIAAVRIAESGGSGQRPVLAFCDLVPVDAELQHLGPSFRAYAGLTIPDGETAWRHLLFENFVTGCAVLGNASLRKAALPIPQAAMMQDWWLALVAANRGVLVDVADPLVLYRQHGGNAIGAQQRGIGNLIGRIGRKPMAMLSHARSWCRGAIEQAACFALLHDGQMPPDHARLYRKFGCLTEKGFLARKRFILRESAATNSRLRVFLLTLIV